MRTRPAKPLALLDALAEALDRLKGESDVSPRQPHVRNTRKYLPSTVPACARCNHERGAPSATTFGVCPVIEQTRQAA